MFQKGIVKPTSHFLTKHSGAISNFMRKASSVAGELSGVVGMYNPALGLAMKGVGSLGRIL